MPSFALPPEAVLAAGITDGWVLTVSSGQAAWAVAASGGASQITDLTDWDTDTLTVPGNLIVQQNGGVAGTDEVEISHDGTNAIITPASGDTSIVGDLRLTGSDDQSLYLGDNDYVRVRSDNSGYQLHFYTRYNASVAQISLNQSQLVMSAATAISWGTYEPRIRKGVYTRCDASNDNKALNAASPTEELTLFGNYGGAYASSTGYHNGTGFRFLLGPGATPTDTNADGGNSGTFRIVVEPGGTGNGTGATGTGSKFHLVDGATQTDVFSVDYLGNVISEAIEANGMICTTKAIKAGIVEAGNQNTSYEFDLNEGNYFEITLTGNPTFTVTNETPGQTFTVRLNQDGTGNRTVTWFSTNWDNGTVPTLTTTANKADILTFLVNGDSSINGGVAFTNVD